MLSIMLGEELVNDDSLEGGAHVDRFNQHHTQTQGGGMFFTPQN